MCTWWEHVTGGGCTLQHLHEATMRMLLICCNKRTKMIKIWFDALVNIKALCTWHVPVFWHSNICVQVAFFLYRNRDFCWKWALYWRGLINCYTGHQTFITQDKASWFHLFFLSLIQMVVIIACHFQAVFFFFTLSLNLSVTASHTVWIHISEKERETEGSWLGGWGCWETDGWKVEGVEVTGERWKEAASEFVGKLEFIYFFGLVLEKVFFFIVPVHHVLLTAQSRFPDFFFS